MIMQEQKSLELHHLLWHGAGIWLAKNSLIFDDKMVHPFSMAVQGIHIISSFKQQRIGKLQE